MRLLRLSDHTKLNLTKHDDDKLPPYAILSHTWGSDDEEVSFDNVQHGEGQDKAGYAKILFCGRQALKDDLKDFWVDTCCIDKRNHSELSEAIISMFRWYQKATKCYVYLNDVSTRKHDRGGVPCDWEGAFRKSRWFTRGCKQHSEDLRMRREPAQLTDTGTLQELLAPKEVEFWSRDGQRLGTKESLSDLVSEITCIPKQAVLGSSLSGFTIWERQRWAAPRETKNQEDKVYCQIGILDVSIPILYGEGRENALRRLLDEVTKLQAPLGQTAASNQDGALPQKTPQERREEVLASLALEQMDSRQSTIKDAQRATCEWLLQHPDYVTWRNKDEECGNQGILWIAGKPGAGKSTLMKFVLAHVKKNRKPNEVVLDFFFNARGGDLEKTTLGMYRSLLLRLLEDTPELQCVLDKIRDDSPGSSLTSPWTLDRLQNLFRDAIGILGPRRLVLFIDALDECPEKEVREMIEFFEDLGEHDLKVESRLSICFASRHYPSLRAAHGWRLTLEDEAGHADDLRKYIHRRLQKGNNTRPLDDIRATVQSKANGVFMWVVLVVGILNEEFERGRIFAVKKRLLELPTELSELFKDLLQRDDKRMGDLHLCLQWILFAKRPLSREEFYQAMEAGLHGDGSQWRPEPWDPDYVTDENMDRFILNSSKGLAELTKSERAPTVQFIHESVRDFLLKDGGLQQFWPELTGDLALLSHKTLQECCSKYVAAVDLSSYLGISNPLPKAHSAKAMRLRQRVACDFPLLEYASQGVLYHANEATGMGTQEAILQAFALEQWVRVHNIVRPYEYGAHGRYSNQVNLLYVLADGNFPQLIRAIGSQDAWLRLPQERYQYPVLAALSNGHRDALKALLGECSIDCLDRIVQDSEFKRFEDCRQLQDPLHWAVEHEQWSFAEFLLTHYADGDIFSVSETTEREGSVLSLAAEGGSATIVQMLIDAGADVNTQGGQHGTALQVASYKGHVRVVQMLIDAGSDVNTQGGQHGTALQAAFDKGHGRVVQMLIDAGASVNAQIRFPSGKVKISQILIDAGADISAQGGLHTEEAD